MTIEASLNKPTRPDPWGGFSWAGFRGRVRVLGRVWRGLHDPMGPIGFGNPCTGHNLLHKSPHLAVDLGS
jgi:hypothetical protein